jgi:hypothetical protein
VLLDRLMVSSVMALSGRSMLLPEGFTGREGGLFDGY